jgi:hypothetical protein
MGVAPSLVLRSLYKDIDEGNGEKVAYLPKEFYHITAAGESIRKDCYVAGGS